MTYVFYKKFFMIYNFYNDGPSYKNYNIHKKF